MKGKGNVKRQRQRRRKRMKHLPEKQKVKHELIDGNMTYYPAAYCKSHGAWLTQGLMDTHRCKQRKCGALVLMKEGTERDGNNQQEVE